MITMPPYLISYDFGDTWIPVPPDLWKYFGAQRNCEQIDQTMQAYPNTNGTLIDGTGMMGAYFIQTSSNLRKVAIWVDQGYVTNPPGSYLEFAGWLYDRETAPIPFIDDSNGTALTPAPCAEGLVQWYWAAEASTMTAAPAKRRRSEVPPLEQFLNDLRQAERNWRQANQR